MFWKKIGKSQENFLGEFSEGSGQGMSVEALEEKKTL